MKAILNKKEKNVFEKEIKKIMRHINFIAIRLTRKYSNIDKTNYSYDDCKQIIMMRLMKAFKRYDSNKSSVSTYFINCAKLESLRLNREIQNKCKKFYNNEISIHEKIFDSSKEEHVEFITILSDSKENVEENIVDKVTLDEVGKVFSGDIKDIFIMLRQGCNLEYIAEQMETSKQNVCNIIRRKIKPVLSSGLYN